MVKEPFLINPPRKGRKPSKKGKHSSSAKGKRSTALTAARKRSRIASSGKAIVTARALRGKQKKRFGFGLLGGRIKKSPIPWTFGFLPSSGVKPRHKGKTRNVRPAWPAKYTHRFRAPHRIKAYTGRDGHLYTSPEARTVKPNMRLNPFGESAMIVGTNPKVRRNRMAKYKRNPIGLGQVTSLAPMIGGGILGAAAVTVVPKVLNLSGWMATGAQAATIVGGGWATSKFINRNVSDGFVVGGATLVLYSVVKSMLGGTLSMLGMGAYPDQLSAFPSGGNELYGDEENMAGFGYSYDEYAM